VLASGNLFGKGLEASPDEVREPVFSLDTVYPEDRDKWYDKDFTARQEYGSFGVRTDGKFKAFRYGRLMDNLYVIGSELAGCNTLYEGSGAGVAILSAMNVADNILSD
ncbi:MAG: FAD-binding protein, partial [Bacteroidales bacterium]|nr:FAD-binding protein [Bacteroidales bacterium]